MIFLNPNDFEGCRASSRILVSKNFLYKTATKEEYKLQLVIGDAGSFTIWEFDSFHNMKKARRKLDRICEEESQKTNELLQKIATKLDNIEFSL